jgi:hypothetical protein
MPRPGAPSRFRVATTATREEVKAQKSVKSGSFGLFCGVSVLSSTGASICVTAAHDLYRLDHFLPLLTTSYA